MFKNILSTSLRHLWRNKIYSMAIILSLGLGFAVANLLMAFIVHELKTDSSFSKKDQVYRVVSEDPFDQGGQLSFIEKNFKEYIDGHYSEISASTQMYVINNRGLTLPDRNLKIERPVVLAVDSSFMDIFDFPIVPGSYRNPIRPGHLMLTRKMTEKMPPGNEIIGKMVDLLSDTGKTTLMISGIIKKSQQNSHLQFDALVYFPDFKKLRGGVTYVRLLPGTDASSFERKINQDPNTPDLIGEGQINYFLQPLEEVYYDTHNSRSFSKARDPLFLWISWTVAFLVVFLAGFNFLNLFFISLYRRWKEFGMKKVLGASKFVFRATAVIEVSTYMGFSLLLSLLLIQWFIPVFNDLMDTSLTIRYFTDSEVIYLIADLIFFVAFVMILSVTHHLYREKPVSLMARQKLHKIRYSRLMLGIQFVISVTLIICSLALVSQVNFIREKPLGFNKQLIEIRLPQNFRNNGNHVLKNRLLQIPAIESVSICSGNPISDNMIARYDLDGDNYYTPYIYYGDDDYIRTLGFQILEGELPKIPESDRKLVNEAFLRYFDIKSPAEAIQQRVPGTQSDYISGVVKDFNIGSLKISIPPAIISRSDQASAILIKPKQENLAGLLSSIGQVWKELNPELAFRYLWVEDEILAKHQEDMVFSKIIVISATISILINCLGLFALSWGTSLERSREMAIRKVMGATNLGVFFLLSRFYLRLISVSFLISIPLTLYLVNWWLERFAYKTEITFKLFLLAAIITGMIALLTISYQTLRSSLMNPVNELRYE